MPRTSRQGRAGINAGQIGLFDAVPALPPGLRYEPDLLTSAEEAALVQNLRELPFRAFEFRGYLGNRRVVSFGWQYDFATERLRKAEDMPDFVLPLRERAAGLAGLAPSDLQHVLLTEYGPGAGIGWHKDKGVFGVVVGISLLAPCVFRLRRKTGSSWERASFRAEPRSAYLLAGPARPNGSIRYRRSKACATRSPSGR